jgi:hypothetical protein
MRRLVSVHQDNPGFWDAARWDWTPAGLAAMAGLRSMTGHRRERMYRGLWVAAEGNVFPEFTESLHVINDFPVPHNWPHFVGWDPGFDHPTCVLWIAVASNGCYYVVDEIYEGGKSVAQHAAEIMRRNRAKAQAGQPRTVKSYYGDPQHAFNATAQSPSTIADQFREATGGVPMIPWRRSSGTGVKESMVNALRQRLTTEPPAIKVFRSCANTINEFQSWRYKRTAKGELPPGDDAFEDANNHALDVLCGLVSENLQHEPLRLQRIDTLPRPSSDEGQPLRRVGGGGKRERRERVEW